MEKYEKKKKWYSFKYLFFMFYLFKLQIIKYIGHLYNYILICTDSTYKRKFISYLSENMEVYICVDESYNYKLYHFDNRCACA